MTGYSLQNKNREIKEVGQLLRYMSKRVKKTWERKKQQGQSKSPTEVKANRYETLVDGA